MPNISIILGIVLGYFVIVLAATVWARYRAHQRIKPTLEEYFFAGRHLPIYVLIGTYIGSLYSAFTVVGVPGSIFTHGLGGVAFVIFCGFLQSVGLIWYGSKIRRYAIESDHPIYSPIECLRYAYDSKKLQVFIAIIAIIALLPFLSLQLVGLGKLIEGISGGDIAYLEGVGAVGTVILLYLFFGGMRAVAYTDFIQAVIIFVGCFAGAALFVSLNWGSVSDLFVQASIQKPALLSLPGPNGFYAPEMFFSYSVLFGVTIFWPHLLTRMMMAQNDQQVKTMAIVNHVSVLVAFIPAIIFGIGGALLYADQTTGNQLMGHIFANISSAGTIGLAVTGCLLIGALGASMSTADSLLLTIGQTVTRDLWRPYYKSKHTLQVIFTKLIMLLAFAGAFYVGINPPKIMISLAGSSLAIFAALTPTFIFFQWQRRCALVGFVSITLGLIVLITLFISGEKFMNMHEGFWVLLTSTVSYGAICFMRKPESA